MGYLEFEAGFSKKAKAMRDHAREFGKEVMRPAGIELDKLTDPEDVIAKGSRLWDVHKLFREEGFHKLMISKAFGGSMEKTPAGAMTLMSDQNGYWDAGLAISLMVAVMPFAAAMISVDAGVRDWARQFAEDKNADMIGCWAITEPDHGTDWIMGVSTEGANPKLTPSTKAVKKGDEYIINGTKAAWVSNGTIATHAVLHISLDHDRGMHGSGIAVCPLDLPGISKGPALDKIGQRPLNQGEIYFEDVKLHKKYMLLGVPGIFGANAFGLGFLGTANSGMGVTFGGLARAVYDEALKFAQENKRGGVPLIEQQSIRLKLFNMFMEVESARLFARTVAEFNRSGPGPVGRAIRSVVMSTKAPFWVAGNGLAKGLQLYEKYHENQKVINFFKKFQKPGKGGGMADWGKYGIASKILSTETSFKAANEAIQILGDRGTNTDYPIEKMFRDARASMIEDGANESLALAASESL